MIKNIEEFIKHMNEQPSASDGFSANQLTVAGMTFGLTCMEIKDIFLGKTRALSYGKYPAYCDDEKILEAAKNSPAKPAKVAKVAKEPKAPKSPHGPRNTSTLVLEKTVTRNATVDAARKGLIAKIASRHAADDRVINELTITSNRTPSACQNELDAIAEEYELIVASGVSLPEPMLN